MTNKEKYHDFCNQTPALPMFLQDWWMDAVCAGKQWDVLISYDNKGEIQAVLPYLLGKRAWMKYIIMPQQTQLGGIWISDATLADNKKRIAEICQDFAHQLAEMKLCYYYQQYCIGSIAVEAMRALGFKAKERVTYRIEDISDTEKLLESFSKNKRRQLQKAQALHVDKQMNAEEFYRYHSRCLRAQGKPINYTREFLLVLERKTARAQQSQIISICNKENQVLAAAYLVWDKQNMYYLIPCYDPQHKDSGASALLVLEAIKLAQEKGVAFDFEGSMIAGVANHYKQFGSTATTYYSIEKYYKWWFWLANAINRLRERKMR